MGDGRRRRCWCCVSPAIMLLSDERFCTASSFLFIIAWKNNAGPAEGDNESRLLF